MELIKGLTSSVKASFPASASNFSAQVKDEDDANVGSAITPVDTNTETPGTQIDNNAVEFLVPHSAVVEEGKYKLVISYTVNSQTYTRTIHFHVATPYLDYWELRQIMTEAEGFTDEEVWEVESAARHMINVYCGQEFGYARKKVTFRGEDGVALSLPERIIQLDSVSENGVVRFDAEAEIGVGNYFSTGSGWFLKRGSGADWDTWGTLYPYPPDPAHVITAPGSYGAGYKNDVEYTLEGIFGYEEVPGPVKEAMKLLVNDYACAEQLYRDRFLESMKAADWRLQFNSGAYYKTGNARANLLLSPYVVNRMKVI